MDEQYYILSTERSRPESLFWWKPDHWGYTMELREAGKYSKEDAFRICAQSNYQDLPVPVYAMAELPYE